MVSGGLFVLGVALILVPTLLWFPPTETEPTLRTVEVVDSTDEDPATYEELPDAVRRTIDAARDESDGASVDDRETLEFLRRQGIVSIDGTHYRLVVYTDERSTLGSALFGPLLVTIGGAFATIAWLCYRHESYEPLTPMRATFVPLGAGVALWMWQTTGGGTGLPPALSLAIPAGTLVVPVGCLCRLSGKRYLVAGPVVGIAAGGLVSVGLGADLGHAWLGLAAVAALSLPWFTLGLLLTDGTSE